MSFHSEMYTRVSTYWKMPAIPETKISANLDMLRAVAVLCVFLSHLLFEFGYPTLVTLGGLGVVFFFLHTSFVLMESLQRLDLVAEDDHRLIKAFWVRRIFRIYPLSILFVSLMVIFHIPSDPSSTYRWIGLRGLLADLALVQNLTASRNVLAPLWTLPLEMQMYVVLPFAYLFLRNRQRYWSAALWLFAMSLGVFLPRLNWRFGIALFAPCFASGIVAFDLLRRRGTATPRLPAWVWPAGIVIAIVLFDPVGGTDAKIHRSWVLSLALALLYVNVREATGHWLLQISHWIAEHSYGIYLSHVVLIWFVLHPMAMAPRWPRVLVLATSSIAVPAILYRFVERPLILAGAHISRRILHPHLRRGS